MNTNITDLEKDPDFPVEVVKRDGRWVVIAYNEGGHNSTEVDIIELLEFIKTNIPDVMKNKKEKFKTSFRDCDKKRICEGDILLEHISVRKVQYSGRKRVGIDINGDERIVNDFGDEWEEAGWIKRCIMWNKDCLVAEMVGKSENIDDSLYSPSYLYYLNETFNGNGFKIIDSVYNLGPGTMETSDKMWCGDEWRKKTYTIIGKGIVPEANISDVLGRLERLKP